MAQLQPRQQPRLNRNRRILDLGSKRRHARPSKRIRAGRDSDAENRRLIASAKGSAARRSADQRAFYPSCRASCSQVLNHADSHQFIRGPFSILNTGRAQREFRLGSQRTCPRIADSGDFVPHFIGHFVESGTFSIKCPTKCAIKLSRKSPPRISQGGSALCLQQSQSRPGASAVPAFRRKTEGRQQTLIACFPGARSLRLRPTLQADAGLRSRHSPR